MLAECSCTFLEWTSWSRHQEMAKCGVEAMVLSSFRTPPHGLTSGSSLVVILNIEHMATSFIAQRSMRRDFSAVDVWC
jgi:hypothetical protein